MPRILLNPPPGYFAPGHVNLQDARYQDAVKDVQVNGPQNIAYTKPNNALIGIYWGYDGANELGTPPRMYFQIVQILANNNSLTTPQRMALYGLVGIARADAGVSAWYNKYFYNIWRPVIGVRNHDASMGNTATPGNPANVAGNPLWLPLGAPATNSKGKKNFSPNFPAYPSGHATFGAASLFLAGALLSKLVASPKLEFDFVSDEFNGVNRDNNGTIRPRHVRRFKSVTDAAVENGVSRVYLGVHWRFDSHMEGADGTPIISRPGQPNFVGGLPLGAEIAKKIADGVGVSAIVNVSSQRTGASGAGTSATPRAGNRRRQAKG